MSKWLCGGVVMCTMSGLASLRSSVRSLKYRLIGNLSYSWRAIRGSRSQTPTISHPLIRMICDACESAILPHPTRATLSMCGSVPAGFEIAPQSFCRRDLRPPTRPALQMLVAVIRVLPVRVPVLTIEDRRQLSLGPDRIPLPEITERVTDTVRNIQ